MFTHISYFSCIINAALVLLLTTQAARGADLNDCGVDDRVVLEYTTETTITVDIDRAACNIYIRHLTVGRIVVNYITDSVLHIENITCTDSDSCIDFSGGANTPTAQRITIRNVRYNPELAGTAGDQSAKLLRHQRPLSIGQFVVENCVITVPSVPTGYGLSIAAMRMETNAEITADKILLRNITVSDDPAGVAFVDSVKNFNAFILQWDYASIEYVKEIEIDQARILILSFVSSAPFSSFYIMSVRWPVFNLKSLKITRSSIFIDSVLINKQDLEIIALQLYDDGGSGLTSPTISNCGTFLISDLYLGVGSVVAPSVSPAMSVFSIHAIEINFAVAGGEVTAFIVESATLEIASQRDSSTTPTSERRLYASFVYIRRRLDNVSLIEVRGGTIRNARGGGAEVIEAAPDAVIRMIFSLYNVAGNPHLALSQVVVRNCSFDDLRIVSSGETQVIAVDFEGQVDFAASSSLVLIDDLRATVAMNTTTTSSTSSQQLVALRVSSLSPFNPANITINNVDFHLSHGGAKSAGIYVFRCENGLRNVATGVALSGISIKSTTTRQPTSATDVMLQHDLVGLFVQGANFSLVNALVIRNLTILTTNHFGTAVLWAAAAYFHTNVDIVTRIDSALLSDIDIGFAAGVDLVGGDAKIGVFVCLSPKLTLSGDLVLARNSKIWASDAPHADAQNEKQGAGFRNHDATNKIFMIIPVYIELVSGVSRITVESVNVIAPSYSPTFTSVHCVKFAGAVTNMESIYVTRCVVDLHETPASALQVDGRVSGYVITSAVRIDGAMTGVRGFTVSHSSVTVNFDVVSQGTGSQLYLSRVGAGSFCVVVWFVGAITGTLATSMTLENLTLVSTVATSVGVENYVVYFHTWSREAVAVDAVSLVFVARDLRATSQAVTKLADAYTTAFYCVGTLSLNRLTISGVSVSGAAAGTGPANGLTLLVRTVQLNGRISNAQHFLLEDAALIWRRHSRSDASSSLLLPATSLYMEHVLFVNAISNVSRITLRRCSTTTTDSIELTHKLNANGVCLAPGAVISTASTQISIDGFTNDITAHSAQSGVVVAALLQQSAVTNEAPSLTLHNIRMTLNVSTRGINRVVAAPYIIEAANAGGFAFVNISEVQFTAESGLNRCSAEDCGIVRVVSTSAQITTRNFTVSDCTISSGTAASFFAIDSQPQQTFSSSIATCGIELENNYLDPVYSAEIVAVKAAQRRNSTARQCNSRWCATGGRCKCRLTSLLNTARL